MPSTLPAVSRKDARRQELSRSATDRQWCIMHSHVKPVCAAGCCWSEPHVGSAKLPRIRICANQMLEESRGLYKRNNIKTATCGQSNLKATVVKPVVERTAPTGCSWLADSGDISTPTAEGQAKHGQTSNNYFPETRRAIKNCHVLAKEAKCGCSCISLTRTGHGKVMVSSINCSVG